MATTMATNDSSTNHLLPLDVRVGNDDDGEWEDNEGVEDCCVGAGVGGGKGNDNVMIFVHSSGFHSRVQTA